MLNENVSIFSRLEHRRERRQQQHAAY